MRPRETTEYEEDVIEAFKKRMILTMPELKAMLHCSNRHGKQTSERVGCAKQL